MSETKTERLEMTLKKLVAIGGVNGSAIVARNGLLIASNLPKDIDDRRFSAMTATMMGAVETAAATLSRGMVKRVTAEIENATVIAMGAGEKAILVVAAGNSGNLGMILLEMEDCAENMKRIMST